MERKLALGAGLLILVALLAAVESRGSETVRLSMVEDIQALDAEIADRPAPPWSLTTLDGKPISLDSLRGKVVFLNFWASWCPPCREEMPSMEQLARKYQGRDLVMVAISQDTDRAQLDAFLKSFMPQGQPVMQIAIDPSAGKISQSYGTKLLPETYIIDRQGRIAARFVNKYDWMRPEVDRFIERLLRE